MRFFGVSAGVVSSRMTSNTIQAFDRARFFAAGQLPSQPKAKLGSVAVGRLHPLFHLHPSDPFTFTPVPLHLHPFTTPPMAFDYAANDTPSRG